MVPVAAQTIKKGLQNDYVRKYVIPILAITVVGGVVYVGYKFIKKDEPPVLQVNPNLPPSSLSDAQAQAIAERLYSAMKGVGGADLKAVKSALTGLTENDFLKVYKAFGKRQYSLFWKNIGDPITSDKHHLITWLTNELSDSDLAEIQKIIPNLLSVAP